MSRRRDAFTLVEVLVVIVVLIIITTITVMSYSKFQGDSRDNARKTKVTILAEALEKYYQQNGEYPSVAAMTSSNTATLKSMLSISDSDVLVMPGASSNVANSITADEPDKDKIAYNGESENASEAQQCQTNQNGGCDSFRLEWKDESNNLLEIKSRKSGRATDQTLIAPATPTLTVTSVSGPALRGTASGSTCSAGVLNYKLAVNTTGQSPNWATIAWTTGSTVQQSSPVPGTTYHFFAIAGCRAGSSGEVASGQAKKSQLYASTGAPTIALSTNSTNLTATATSTTACPSGTTIKYLIQYDIDTTSANGSWTTGQNWTTANTYTTTSYTSTSPRAFNYRAQIRCDDNTTGAQSTPSSTSQVATLITAPAAPVVSLVSSTDKDTKTWQWADVSCPVGTSAEYLSTYSRDDSTGWRAYPSDDTASSDTTYTLATNYQGYAYTVKTKARCSVGESVSAWSNEGIGPSYTRIVDTPATAASFTWLAKLSEIENNTTEYNTARAYWTSPTCGIGTQRYIQQRSIVTRARSDGNKLDVGWVWQNIFTAQNADDSDMENASRGTTLDGTAYVSNDYRTTEEKNAISSWQSSSTTISNLSSYYRYASSIATADEIRNNVNNYRSSRGGAYPGTINTWQTWIPTSSDPMLRSTNTYDGNSTYDYHMSKMRIYARTACVNLDTNRFSVSAGALSPVKTWTAR